MSYLLFHTLAELFSVAIAMVALAVATVSYRFSRNHFMVYLAIGIGWCAVIDLCHLLVFKGMAIIPTTDTNYPTQLWVVARSIEALALISSVIFLRRSLRVTYVHAGFGLLSLGACIAIATGNFPDCYIDGSGLTPFKIYSEYAIIVVLIASLTIFWRNRGLMPKRLFVTLAATIVATILSEFAFTRFVSVYATANLVGHIFKIFAFWYIYMALVETTLRQPFAVLAHAASTYDAVPDPTFVVQADGKISQANRAAGVALGKAPADLVGGSIHQLFHDASVSSRDCPVCARVASGDTQFMVEIERSAGAGSVECSVAAFGDSGGRAFVEVVRDITARKQVEDRLRLAASVFTHAREGIMIVDANGTLIEVNDTFSQITGFTRQEAVGQNLRILQSGHELFQSYTDLWNALLNKGQWSGEIWNRRKSGQMFAAMLTISAVRDKTGVTQQFVGLFTDITVMKEHQQQLEQIAHFDALTNLPNRVLLDDRLRQAMAQTMRRGNMLAVAYLDLDGFKAINDVYGHDVGDEMLVTLSQRIRTALRDGDTLARMGGDEFVMVMVDLQGPVDCVPVLNRLLEVASQAVTLGDFILRVSASIGVTLYPRDGADAELLLRHADQAMYQAKDAGKNRYHFFDVDSAAATQTRRESVEDIRQAIERREFVLYYQPKVNMRTGAVVGAEALIRWLHPQRGILAPADFLPTIEGHSISIDLGDWVIDTALKQIGIWQTAGLAMPVSVNIGAHQLQHVNFVASLAQALSAHPEVRPDQLELEILETSALADVAQVSELMHACRNLGVEFSLDDFGTGYSSLTYLKRLPAHLLKIDQSFVQNMLSDPDDLAIVKGVIGLAAACRRAVIAEGVETIELGAMLLSLGCELVQGYGIAWPMPAADLPRWVEAWHANPVWTVELQPQRSAAQ